MCKINKKRIVIRYAGLILLLVTFFYHVYLFKTINVRQTTKNSIPVLKTEHVNKLQKTGVIKLPHTGKNEALFTSGKEPPHAGNEAAIYKIKNDKKGKHEENLETMIKTDSADSEIPKANGGYDTYIVPSNQNVTNINSEHISDKISLLEPKNVYFAKTHKAASSTIQNILFRYGEKYNLTFAMPWHGHRAGYPDHFTNDVIIPLAHDSVEYNIFCHHTRYHPRVRNFMPNDTFYIGTVRSVEHQFLSGYMYHKFYECYGTTANNITQLLEVMREYKHGLQCSRWKVSSQSEQLFDFGYEIKDMLNVTMIKNYIHYLDSVFDFIIIADYFYESLVLLADMLNLPLSDMVYHQLMQVKRHPDLSDKDIEMLKKWNIADYMLYDHFNQSFWKRIEMYGEQKLYNEVESLKQLQSTATFTCQENPENIVCELMKLSETEFTHDLKMKMIFEEHLDISRESQVKFNTKWPSKLQRSYPFHSRTFKDHHFKNSEIEKQFLSMMEQR